MIWTFPWTLWIRWEGLGNGMSSAQSPFKPKGGEREPKEMIMMVSITCIQCDLKPFLRFLCWHEESESWSHTHFEGGMARGSHCRVTVDTMGEMGCKESLWRSSTKKKPKKKSSKPPISCLILACMLHVHAIAPSNILKLCWEKSCCFYIPKTFFTKSLLTVVSVSSRSNSIERRSKLLSMLGR